MFIETERLEIYLLNPRQLRAYVENDFALEKELQLESTKREIEEPLKRLIQDSILPGLAKNQEYLGYRSIWLITDKINKVIVGSFAFKGKPSKSGEVEIGYGTSVAYRRKGYMTEAIAGLIEWMKSKRLGLVVRAETDKSNIASQVVLKKNGFLPIDSIDDMIWWERAI